MATITPTIKKLGPAAMVISWLNVTKDDTCDPVEIGELTDKSIQIEGTPDGGTLVLQGSNDKSPEDDVAGNFRTLSDMSDNPLSWTTFGVIDSVGPTARWVRPSLSAGTAPVANIYLYARRP